MGQDSGQDTRQEIIRNMTGGRIGQDGTAQDTGHWESQDMAGLQLGTLLGFALSEQFERGFRRSCPSEQLEQFWVCLGIVVGQLLLSCS